MAQAFPTATADLLNTIDTIDESMVKPLVQQVLERAARRVAPSLPARESELLLKINRGLPANVNARLRELVAKRRADSLTDEEHTELLGLTDQTEKLQAERVGHLIELADARGVTLPTLMEQLGLEPPPVE